jgi:hypothetical protein
MPKPISSNVKPVSLTVPADPVANYTAKNAPKKKGKGKSVEVSPASAPKVLPQSPSVQNSPFRPRKKFEREAGEVALYRTKGKPPLAQYAGLTKKEFVLMKGFCIHQGLCTADYADGFVKEIFSDKTKLHELKFKYESLFQLAVYDRSLEVLKLLVEQGGVPQWDCLSRDWGNIPSRLFFNLLIAPPVCTPNDFKLAAFLAKDCGWAGAFNVERASEPFIIEIIKEKEFVDALERLKFLHEHGADVNILNFYTSNMYGCGTPLLAAIQAGRKDIIEFLIKDCGADVNFQDSHGHTPLMLACEQLDLGTVSLLLAHGANPELEYYKLWFESAMSDWVANSSFSQQDNDFLKIFMEMYKHMSPEYRAQLDERYQDNPFYQEAKNRMNARFKKTKSARKVDL